LSIRRICGTPGVWLFGWDRAPSTLSGSKKFADRLTVADRARSLAPVGQRDGLFRVVYRFENEQLVELINRTAHAAALSALVETATAYRFYFAVYVRSVGWLTPVHMALIKPFRTLVVYPSPARRACELEADRGRGLARLGRKKHRRRITLESRRKIVKCRGERPRRTRRVLPPDLTAGNSLMYIAIRL
jgi:Protein of unknown function (DUF2867)